MAWTAPKTDFVSGNILTAAQMNAIGENLNALTIGRRLAVGTRTTDYTASATTIATAADFFSSDVSWTAVAATEYVIEFYCGRVLPSDYVVLNLVNGAGTGLACLAVQNAQGAMFARYNYTPGAGAAAINVRGVRGASNATFYCASGGTGVFDYAPATLTVYGPATTT